MPVDDPAIGANDFTGINIPSISREALISHGTRNDTEPQILVNGGKVRHIKGRVITILGFVNYHPRPYGLELDDGGSFFIFFDGLLIAGDRETGDNADNHDNDDQLH
jgi:hypothetical protein